MQAIGIDIGGTKMLSVRYDTRTWQPLERVLHPTGEALTIPQLRALLRESITALRTPTVRSIGIGVPGVVDGGKIITLPNLPQLQDVPLLAFLEQETGLPVALANDASLFTLAEHHAAGGEGITLGLIIGTGVGVGLCVEGQLYHGAHGRAPEMGHIRVHRSGTATVEQLLAGPGLARFFATEDMAAIEAEYTQHAEALTEEIYPRLLLLVEFLYTLVRAYDPHRIVIGGSAGLSFWQLFAEEIAQELRHRYPLPHPLPVLRWSQTTDAGALGAAQYGARAL
ncbi:ROK family protein [Candidatus Peribacteria bacterium]|nr:ROK family protein [Candidatus Peribacteria bacterium]